MKAIKNLFAVPPKSQTRATRLSCHQCKKSFKPSDHEQVYCSINCARMESWLAMNKAHIAKQRALNLRQYSDADIPDSKRSSLAPSRFSFSDKLDTACPTTAPPWRNDFSLQSSPNRDGPGSPKRVLRKRSRSTTLCSIPPSLPPSPSSSSFQRMSRRISQTPSQNGSVVMDPFYHPDPHEHTAYSRLVVQNRSAVSLTLPPRPHLPSSKSVPNPTPRTPFLARKPNHPISSAARPTTMPGPLKKSITFTLGTPAAEGAPPTPPPDLAGAPARLRLRAGFDRRATRPRSNSFGGFGSLAIRAT